MICVRSTESLLVKSNKSIDLLHFFQRKVTSYLFGVHWLISLRRFYWAFINWIEIEFYCTPNYHKDLTAVFCRSSNDAMNECGVLSIT